MYSSGSPPKGFVEEWRSGRSFVWRRPGLKARHSVCSSTRGRLEARYLARTWKDSGSSVEVVVAEFGPHRRVFSCDSDFEDLDTYIFCWYPDDAPFCASWWKNVPAFHARGDILCQVDCDIAIAPRTMDVVDSLTPRGGVFWPAVLSETLAAVTGRPRFEEIRIDGTTCNYERVVVWPTQIMRGVGGWPEWYTGRKNTWMLLKRQWRGLQVRTECPSNLFAHVPHMMMVNCRNDEYRGRIADFSCPTWTFDLNGWDINDGNARWPLAGWEPGRPDLYEAFWGGDDGSKKREGD